MSKVISISNQKGGVGKTTTCINLGIGLARYGKKVLIIDADAQGSLTASLGYREPDEIPVTLATLMGKIIDGQINDDTTVDPQEGLLHHAEGISLLPANIELSGIDVRLVNTMSRETILKQYIDAVKSNYDYVLVDCMPSLGMMTVNALAAADSVIIPVQAQYLSVKGLEQLLHSIKNVRRQINPNLAVAGVLVTMVDTRTNYSKDIIALLKQNYDRKLNIYKNAIPLSVRASEISATGTSIYAHDPNGKVAQAYDSLTKEVLIHG